VAHDRQPGAIDWALPDRLRECRLDEDLVVTVVADDHIPGFFVARVWRDDHVREFFGHRKCVLAGAPGAAGAVKGDRQRQRHAEDDGFGNVDDAVAHAVESERVYAGRQRRRACDTRFEPDCGKPHPAAREKPAPRDFHA
jgi:hypothetical protein